MTVALRKNLFTGHLLHAGGIHTLQAGVLYPNVTMGVFLNSPEVSRSTQTYQEQLLNLGRYLKAIRTQQGVSLQQVAQRTYIQPSQLRAIETGNWMKLPEAIYVKGFLKTYAQFLGLDGTSIANKVFAEPVAINPQWLNKSDFSSREQTAGPSLGHWLAKLTPLA